MACLGGHLGSRRWYPGLPALCPQPGAPRGGRGGPDREGMVGCKWEGGSQSVGVQGCCAVLWGHRLQDRAGRSGVSPAGFAASLPSGCSPGPQGMGSTGWVLQGDEGKPHHGADAQGVRATRVQTTAATQPGWRVLRVQGGTLQLPPAHLCPAPCIPAMLRGPSSIPPALEMPTSHRKGQSSPAMQTEDGQGFGQRVAAGRGGQPWVPSCPSY